MCTSCCFSCFGSLCDITIRGIIVPCSFLIGVAICRLLKLKEFSWFGAKIPACLLWCHHVEPSVILRGETERKSVISALGHCVYWTSNILGWLQQPVCVSVRVCDREREWEREGGSLSRPEERTPLTGCFSTQSTAFQFLLSCSAAFWENCSDDNDQRFSHFKALGELWLGWILPHEEELSEHPDGRTGHHAAPPPQHSDQR